jgi:hypothetical protein
MGSLPFASLRHDCGKEADTGYRDAAPVSYRSTVHCRVGLRRQHFDSTGAKVDQNLV